VVVVFIASAEAAVVIVAMRDVNPTDVAAALVWSLLQLPDVHAASHAICHMHAAPFSQQWLLPTMPGFT
jgi:hypothetical protein